MVQPYFRPSETVDARADFYLGGFFQSYGIKQLGYRIKSRLLN